MALSIGGEAGLLQAEWPFRDESLLDIAGRASAMIAMLGSLIPQIAVGVWQSLDDGRAVDVQDQEQLAATFAASPMRSKYGEPDIGWYVPKLWWSLPGEDSTRGADTIALNLNVVTSDAFDAVSSTCSVSWTFQGERLLSHLRDNAEAMVARLAELWRPDTARYSDRALNRLVRDLRDPVLRPGYVVWVSGALSGAQVPIEGLSSRATGGGTMLVVEGDAAIAARVWHDLLAPGELRRMLV